MKRERFGPAVEDAPRLPMDAFDAANLRLDDNYIRSVLPLDGKPDLEALADGLDRLADRFWKLRVVARQSPTPHWQAVAGFRGRDNLVLLRLPQACGLSDYLEALARLDLRSLLAGRPAWLWAAVEGAPDAEPPAALLFCWHHSIADGRFGMMLAQELGGSRSIAAASKIDHRSRSASLGAGLVAGVAWAGGTVAGLVTGRRRAASPVALAYDAVATPRSALKKLAGRLSADLETTILALAQSLFRLVPGRRRRARGLLVPISLHRAVPRGLVSNAFIPARVPMAGALTSSGAANLARHVRRARELSRGAFARAVLRALVGIDVRLGRLLPNAVSARARRGSAAGFAGTATIIPGPVRPLSIAGARVRSMIGFTPLVEGSALSVAAVTYAGGVAFGLTRDRNTMADPTPLLDALHQALGGKATGRSQAWNEKDADPIGETLSAEPDGQASAL